MTKTALTGWTLPELISAARLAELTIPATKDADASLYAKLDMLL